MNVHPPEEDSQPTATNSTPPGAASPAPELARCDNEPVSEALPEVGNAKLHAQSAAVAKDAILEESEKQSALKSKKKRTWKKPQVGGSFGLQVGWRIDKLCAVTPSFSLRSHWLSA